MIKSKIKRLGINLKSVAYIRDVFLIQKKFILGVLKNATCYKTGRISTRDFTVHILGLKTKVE